MFLDESKAEEAKKWPQWKVRLDKLLESYPVVATMSLVTIYTLFFDDIREIALPASADPIAWGVTCGCTALFLIELVLAAIVKEDYFLSFFFWLDLISTLSLIPDIGWIWNLMTGSGGPGQAGNAA